MFCSYLLWAHVYAVMPMSQCYTLRLEKGSAAVQKAGQLTSHQQVQQKTARVICDVIHLAFMASVKPQA